MSVIFRNLKSESSCRGSSGSLQHQRIVLRSLEAPGRTLSLSRIASISVLCGLTALVVIGYAFSRPFTDFGVYYTAAHIFADHHNPYSLSEVFVAQKALGFREPIPVMFMYPPWVLTLIAPLGFTTSYVLVWIGWLSLLVASVALASRFLMDTYFGAIQLPEISDPAGYRYLFAFTFYPVLMALKFTQFSPVVLLGIAGCVRYRSRGYPMFAGLMFSLTLLKPHLVLLLWLALVLEREWKILATAITVGCTFSALTLFRYPAAFRDYWQLMSGPYPALTVSGMLGGIRAVFENPANYWLQFIPPLLGIVWLAQYWYRHRRGWSLIGRLPTLIVASVMASPYGYTHDQILLIVPIIYLASQMAKIYGKIRASAVVLYTLLNASILIVLILAVHWAILIAPICLAITLLVASSKNVAGPRETGDRHLLRANL
jgi:hypothetical protein